MSIKKKLEANKDYILESLKKGVSTVKLALEFDCNPGTIYLYAKEYGVSSTFKRKNYGEIDSRVEEIKKMYNDGMTAYKIGKELGFAKCSILRVLKKYGVNTSRDRKLDPNKEFLKDKIDEIITLYKGGMSQNKIAEQLGYSNGEVCKLLQKHNIDIRPVNIYNYDGSYFKAIDTPDKSYLLGLFFADGHNKNYNGGLSIVLQEGDIDILKECGRQFKYDGPLYYSKPKNERCHAQYRFSISRAELSKDLDNLGAPGNKTFKIRFPSYLDAELWSSFLAGYTMGDGSINKNYWNIASNWHFIHDVQKILPVTSFVYYRKKYTDENKRPSSLFVNRKIDRSILYRWLYSIPCSFFQYDRKYKKAMDFLKQV